MYLYFYLRLAIHYKVELSILIFNFQYITLHTVLYFSLIENSLDVYWPIPYIYFSALPLSPIINGLNKRFIGGPQRKIQRKSEWLKHPKEFSSVSTSLSKVSSSSSPDRRIAIGIFGGHMNNHPVGQIVLHRVLTELSSALFKITLIATPLIPDDMTKYIASMMHSIVNLPLDTKAAWNVIDQLIIDVMLFPDWQPFPDQQAFFFHSRRIAPVQICLFIRGGSCGSTSIDYYILPDELYDHYKEMTRLFWERHGVQSFSEQVLLIDWKIYTQQSIHEMAQATLLQGTGNTDVGVNEIEGRIFFEGQPVAVYAADPSYCHPLMDEVLFRVMHSCPSLQIIIGNMTFLDLLSSLHFLFFPFLLFPSFPFFSLTFLSFFSLPFPFLSFPFLSFPFLSFPFFLHYFYLLIYFFICSCFFVIFLT